MKTMMLPLAKLIDQPRFWRFALALSVVAILYLATTSSPYPLPATPSDKLNHLLAFLELTLLARLGWPGARRLPVVIALASYGVAIELIQSQLDHREFSGADMLADGVGILLGLMLWPLLRRWQALAAGSPDQCDNHQRQCARSLTKR
ncbi:VanZ family protein [Marinobacter sp. SS21]|uniref:VanZ family protein n=1 Tax=Marinobacter sp. SS21 TaxID=2979460 RepID=UPI00232D9AF5|nr:VanZ family protein [Marinobacter sp. SS21]MDC0662213.1 VanZ family protein [Marinobacter sp. SS21]